MEDIKIDKTQTDINIVITELKNRFTTVNGYLKGDIKDLNNVKKLFERRRNLPIDKLQMPLDSQLKCKLQMRLLTAFLVCIVAATLIVYSGIFDFGNLFPPMADLASAIHASTHSNIIFDWILPITITTLILLVINIIVIGMIVFPIAKICDSGLAMLHHQTQVEISAKKLIHEINTNVIHLGVQLESVNNIIDVMIISAQDSNDLNDVKNLQDIKADLMSYAIQHYGYYSILTKNLSS